jgi:hypothetical protein
VVAGTLEYDVARALGFLPQLSIGLIEESAKLIVPLGFDFFGRYRSEAPGIVLGVATAGGCAAGPTTGYGFVSLLTSRGNLGILDEVLLVRGLNSPAGHMSWTGLVCAGLTLEGKAQGRACYVDLAGGWRCPDGGNSARPMGHLREHQERYLRRVLEPSVPEPAGSGGQSGAPAPTSARGSPSQRMMTMSLFIGHVEKRCSPKRGPLRCSLKEVGFYFSIFSCWDGYKEE